MDFKSPFPYFGGKRLVADVVWRAFGDVQNYVEPFFGSGAVLFGRLTKPKVEVVNDKDHWIANFWRAVQHDPEQVAVFADNPVNEDDLTARQIYLVKYVMPELKKRIVADPDYYDAKAAGWWVWGMSCWIGGGWCSGRGSWTEEDGELVKVSGGDLGVARQRPQLGSSQGVDRKRPQLGSGRGVARQKPHLGSGEGVARENTRGDLTGYMQSLSDRLRGVRVCAGDWSRVVTDGALSSGSVVGIFLDPPYTIESGRDEDIYSTDDLSIGHEVAAWAIAHGDNPRFRIALCGYAGEYNIPKTWKVHRWTARASYQNSSGGGKNSENRKKETIWFSPHCLPLGYQQVNLFGSEE